MPIYLAHGFRWPRDGFKGIRVHAIVNNLEDVSVEYIQNPSSRAALLQSLRSQHPTLLAPLESSGRALDFLEQYDPDDTSAAAVSQPYAFVCDWVVMIAGGQNAEHYAASLLQSEAARPVSPRHPARTRAKTQPMSVAAPFNTPATITNLSVNIEEVMTDSPPLTTEAWQAMADLRDKLADGEKIGWWIVYNGDPDRYYSDTDEDEGEEIDEGEADTERETQELDQQVSRSPEGHRPSPQTTSTDSSAVHPQRVRSPTGGRMPPPVPPAPMKTPTQFNSKPLPMHPQPSPESKDKKDPGETKAPKSPGLRKKFFGRKT